MFIWLGPAANSRSHRGGVLFALLSVLGLHSAFATQPVRFNYQAKLADADGTPLQGTHTLYVTIWNLGNVDTPDGGVQRYGETATVTAVDGVVNHVVGTGDFSGFGVPLDDAILNRSNDIILQVAVDSPSNIIMPRTRLQSVPFAVTARNADSSRDSVPPGYQILGPTEAAPAGFTATGSVIFGNWVERPPLPTGTNRLAAASLGGKVYAVGGDQGGVRSITN